jgi:2-methylcitrate dehydratase
MKTRIQKLLFSSVVLKSNSNQAFELGKYAINFLERGEPSGKVMDRCKMFHTDSVLCGLSALAMKTNAPTVLRN